MASLTRSVSELGKASLRLAVTTVLPHNSSASHGGSKGPPVTKRIWAVTEAPPRPHGCLQLPRNHQELEVGTTLGFQF
jgi:hypothetical protein